LDERSEIREPILVQVTGNVRGAERQFVT
jgi:hypothetical protein